MLVQYHSLTNKPANKVQFILFIYILMEQNTEVTLLESFLSLNSWLSYVGFLYDLIAVICKLTWCLVKVGQN